jgi:hypothetical protein
VLTGPEVAKDPGYQIAMQISQKLSSCLLFGNGTIGYPTAEKQDDTLETALLPVVEFWDLKFGNRSRKICALARKREMIEQA